MDTLYSLALLLTGCAERAQECFLAALHDCRAGSAVFREWARSWSRRTVIKSAIRLLEPGLLHSADALDGGTDAIASCLHPAARVVLKLGLFQRFVFVITVLEGYAIRECAALLGYSPREVQQAQLRALEEIGRISRDVPALPFADGGPAQRELVAALH